MRKIFLPAISILLAVIVFSFLCYSQPWLMTAREQSQLWLCSLDYLGFRLSEPGGLARYFGEFIVQFYYYIGWGATVTAIFVLVMNWTWWLAVCRIWHHWREDACPKWLLILSLIPFAWLWLQLLDVNVQMTLPAAVFITLLLSFLIPNQRKASFPIAITLMLVDWWLAGTICILLPILTPWVVLGTSRPTIIRALSRTAVAVILLTSAILLYAPHSNRPLRVIIKGIDYKLQDGFIGTEEEQQYDLLVHLGLWERLLATAQKNPPQKKSCRYAVLLAQWQLYNTGEHELRQCILDTWGSLSSCCSSLLMSDLYLKLGWLNMSQRAAYEALVSYPNYNYSGRALKRLTETSLVTGRYEMVEKYTHLLEKAPFYRSWAQEALQMSRQPELIEQNVNCRNLRQTYNMTPDAMFY